MRFQKALFTSGKVDEKGESGKNRHGFRKYSNCMTKAVSWRVAIMTKTANRTKIMKAASKLWRIIASGLAKILIRLQEALLAKKKSSLNDESDKNGES